MNISPSGIRSMATRHVIGRQPGWDYRVNTDMATSLVVSALTLPAAHLVAAKNINRRRLESPGAIVARRHAPGAGLERVTRWRHAAFEHVPDFLHEL